jgi:hypothetical protein
LYNTGCIEREREREREREKRRESIQRCKYGREDGVSDGEIQHVLIDQEREKDGDQAI